ncbi:MAG TPA: DUF4035 domain-containing protein [Kiloniellales bacterium]
MAFSRLEPFGELRADYRAGIVASTFYNLLRGRKARGRGPEDFMPFLKAERRWGDPKGRRVSARIRSFFKSREKS